MERKNRVSIAILVAGMYLFLSSLVELVFYTICSMLDFIFSWFKYGLLGVNPPLVSLSIVIIGFLLMFWGLKRIGKGEGKNIAFVISGLLLIIKSLIFSIYDLISIFTLPKAFQAFRYTLGPKFLVYFIIIVLGVILFMELKIGSRKENKIETMG